MGLGKKLSQLMYCPLPNNNDWFLLTIFTNIQEIIKTIQIKIIHLLD
jgi:hypothetical protein